jgi:ATP-dependent DNA helicase RecQ
MDTKSIPSPLGLLRDRFGFADFREGQEEVIEAILAGDDVLTIMPTGSGKSLCYQLPALALEGVTVVISPLIALMKDQVDALERRRIPAAFINSTLTLEEQRQRIAAVRHGAYKLIYVAPERFRSQMFVEGLTGVAVSLFAVDEAHCVSEWGHDFRPDYLRLKSAIERLGRPRVVALTATATPEVRADIALQLGLREPKLFVTGFDRKNLFLEVIPTAGDNEKLDSILQIIAGIKQKRSQSAAGSDREDPCGIIYAATRNNVEMIAEELRTVGLKIAPYHAGMDDVDRHRVQNEFMSSRISMVAATNAFGMGIDKSNLRFVIHFNIPGSLEAYYQEIGRAGRDGLPSHCSLLWNYADTRTQEFFIESSYPPREVIEDIYQTLLGFGEDEILLTHREIKQLTPSVDSEMSISSALKILEKGGVLERGLDRGAVARITLLPRFMAEMKSTTPALRTRSGSLDDATRLRTRLMDALTLSLESHLGEPRQVDLEELAESLAVDLDSVRRGLRPLVSSGLIHYEAPFRGRGIRLLSRSSFRSIPIPWEELERRAELEHRKLRRMVDYACHPKCSRAFILNYFGESPRHPQCGFCGNCSHAVVEEERSLTPEETLVVRKILSCVARMKGRFGRMRVAQVLSGSRVKQIEALGLDKLSTYGLLSDFSQDTLSDWIDRLVQSGALEIHGEDYPTINLTPFGWEVMQEKATLKLLFPKEVSRVTAAAAARSRRAPVPEAALLKRKKAKGESEAETLAMLREGLSIEEIARRRRLKTPTVTGHIVTLLQAGEPLDVTKLVPASRINLIRKAMKNTPGFSLKSLKAALPAFISFQDIQLVLAMRRRRR